MAEDKRKNLGKEISMDVKDTFFDDPFFRDWWNDFDVPMKDKTLQRQISETPRKGMLDSFFDLKMGKGLEGQGGFTSSRFTSSSSFALKDGKFSLTVDSKNFDPEDIDIRVEGEKLIVHGERDVQKGSSSFKSQFHKSYDLPKGIDVENISSQINSSGQLVISAPSLLKEEEDTNLVIERCMASMGPSTEEKFEVKKETLADGSEATTTIQETTTKEEKVIPMAIGGTGGSMTMSSKRTSSTTSTSTQGGEMSIPISRGGITAVKSPRPRTLPFAFDSMGGMDLSMPSLNMPSADDMMAQMQKQMEAQMQSMMSGMGSMQVSMPSMQMTHDEWYGIYASFHAINANDTGIFFFFNNNLPRNGTTNPTTKSCQNSTSSSATTRDSSRVLCTTSSN